jgi:ELWxxDGT repeat protein
MKFAYVLGVALLWACGCYAQLSLFKNINLQEMGSSPENFVEVNGMVYFTVTHTDGYRLWKTDGTGAGTVQISEQNINIPSPEYAVLFPFNGYLYYYISNGEEGIELWKTDGASQLFVMNTYPRNFFSYQNELYYLDTSPRQLKKLVNDSSVIVTTIPASLEFVGQDPIILNQQILFYTQTKNPINSLFQFQLWKSDGTEAGTSIFKQMDSTGYFPTYFPSFEKNKKMSRVEEVVYFFIYKKLPNDVLSTYQCQFWKTNGTADGTTFVKSIPVTSNTSGPFYLSYPTILASIGDRVLFKTFTEVWSSNGSAEGTVFIKDFPVFGLDYSAFAFKDRFYFAANDGANGNELWQSDGTPENTKLLKDINPNGGSNPFYFQTNNDKLYFLTNMYLLADGYNNSYQLWETDGTTEGTKLIQPVANQVGLKPAAIQTLANELIFKNYDLQNGDELWKSDLTLHKATLLKNIRTDDRGTFMVNLMKVGKYWYFTASDYRGTELWRTDGTPQGTTIVKDINSGENGIIMREYVGMGGFLYFTFIFGNSSNNKIYLFRTDGTENGTVEIPLNSNSTTTNVNPTSLRATSNRVFFLGFHQSHGDKTVWASDGTSLGTTLLRRTPFLRPSSNLTVVNNLLFFTAGQLWLSDGTEAGTKIVLSQSSNLTPTNPINLTEFKGKLYFFGFYYLNLFEAGYAIIESDGTEVGTKIVHKIDDSVSGPGLLLFFLKKTADKLYFSTDNSVDNRVFDLWATDGTSSGTYKVKTISYNTYINRLEFAVVNQRLYFQSYSSSNLPSQWWSTDGTEQGTYEIKLANSKAKLDFTSAQKFNNKLYLNIYTPELGMELWSSDGTTSGTRLVDEVRTGANSSYVSSLMDFEDKLLFGANDGEHGNELWQYVPNPCDNNQNYSIKSGLWNDPSVWFCGRVPTENDAVIIKNSHTVTVPVGYTAKASMFYTEQAAILDVPNGAFVLFKPN